MKKMCDPVRSSWKINSVKRGKLFSGEGGATAVETPQRTSGNMYNEERGGLERASSSKTDDAMEGNNYVVEEGSKYVDEVVTTQCPEDEGSNKDSLTLDIGDTSVDPLEFCICILEDENPDEETHSNSVGDVTPKRNLRPRTPLKNSIPKVGKGFVNGEREWSPEEKEKLLSILKNDGFDGDSEKLAEKFPNQSAEAVRYLINKCEQEREKLDWEIVLNTKIEELRGKEEDAHFSENLPLFFQMHSLYGTLPEPSLVGGVDYRAIYAYIASLMRGEVPKELNPVTWAKLFQVFNLFKQRILAEPEVPMPEFIRNAELNIEKTKELKERRSKVWSADEKRAKEILLSGDVAGVEEFYMSQASLNPF